MMPRPGACNELLSGPSRFARWSNSIMLWASWSPVIFAWAFRMAGFAAPHPGLSLRKSTDLLSIIWRLCSDVSDWWAKEKECNDSDGNLLRSSPKGRVGDEGPEGNEAGNGCEGRFRFSEGERDVCSWGEVG